MRFRVLGPIEVTGSLGLVRIQGEKEGTLLALLLTRANQVVSEDQLIAALWGDSPPRTASKTLHSYVARLRRKLEPERARGRPATVLVTQPPGYLLRVDTDELDAARFEELGAKGRRQLRAGAVNLAAASLREALTLWRGTPYQELQAVDVIAAESDRLTELRFGMLEDRLEADIRMGRAREVTAELEGLVRESPLRERLWELLMLAYYRAGRQADSIDAFATVREVLLEELGVEPGPDLQRLQRDILSQNPELDERWTIAVPALPSDLDPATPLFGRSEELRWLGSAWDRAEAGAGGVALVEGESGMGKTRLIGEIARRAFESGSAALYASCRTEHADYRGPLGQVLAQCGGVLDEVVPDGAAEDPGAKLVERVLDLTAGTRVLLVIEDLEDAERELLEVLEGVVRSVGDRPVLLVLSHDKDAPPGPLWSFLDRIDPLRRARVALSPLEPQHVRKIVELYADNEEVEPAFEALRGESGGSPSRVHQMAAAYVRARVADRVEDAADETSLTRTALRNAEQQLVSGITQMQTLGGREPAAGQAISLAVDYCPYKGLASFGPDDRSLFFGRERLTAEMAARLVGADLLAVVGPSGSGKSSAIAAGLLPALADGVLPGSTTWAQTVTRPGDRPLENLLAALRTNGNTGAAASDLEDFVRRIGPTLLVIDQFEEVFTSCADEAQRDAFVDSVSRAATHSALPLRVVVGMRSDFYGRAGAYPVLAELISRNHVLVGPMHAAELRQAIELPARRARVGVEPALVDSLVEEALGEPGALPLLSASLFELWQRRSGTDLRLRDHLEAGGVRGAVARLAENAYGGMTAPEREAARRVLLRLVDPTEDEIYMRRRAELAEFDLDSDAVVRAALERLIVDRLVTATETSVEIAHEALLREWPRLRTWIEEEAEGTRLHRHLTRAAREWAEAGRDPSELYRGARLATALEWRSGGTGGLAVGLNELERDFLEASAALEERTRRERSRQVRIAAITAAAALVVLAVLAVFGLLQARDADRQGRLALSREVAAEASNQLAIDPQLSLLLAIEAFEIAPSAQAEAALRQAVVSSHLRAVLPGNAGFIFSQVAFSPDDRLVATGGLDGARLWDARTGEAIAALPEGAGTNAIAFSPDGTRLAVGVVGQDSNIWSVGDHEMVATIADAGNGGANHVEWVSDDRVLTVRADGTATIADAATGEAVFPLEADAEVRGENIAGPISDLALSPRRYLVAAADELGLTRVWRASNGAILHTLRGHAGPVNAVDFSPDGRMLATAGDDFTARVWDAATGTTLHVLRGHKSQVLSVLFTPDGRFVVTGDAVGEIRVWRVADGGTETVLLGHGDAIFPKGLAFTRDGQFLVSGSADATVSVWDLETGGRVAELLGHTGRVEGVALSSDGRRIATAADDGGRVWRTPPGATRVLRGHEDGILSARLSPDHETLVTGSFDGTARVWNLETGKTVQTLRPAEGIFQVGSASFDRDGDRVVTAASGPEFLPPQVWDVASGRVVERIPIAARSVPELCGPAPCPVFDAAFSPDGARVAVVRVDGRVFVWDAAAKTMVTSMVVEEGGAARAAWSPDGSLIAVGSPLGGDPHLFDAATGKVVHVLKGHRGQQQSAVDFSPDGRFVVTTSHDATARVWDVETGEPVAVLRHRSKVSRAVFSPSGKFLLTASGPAATLWDVASEKSLTQFPGHRGEVTWVEFVSDREVLSASDDRTVRFYSCEVCGTTEELLRLARSRVQRSLTAAERARFLHEPT